jgi:uncharacterized cupredoxin-like copper-binding protein
MVQPLYAVYAAVVATSLAGCGFGQTDAPQTTAAGGQFAAADWTRAEPIDVVLTEFALKPSQIRLRADRSYRLHLENRGSSDHSFSAPGFFRAAALHDDPVAAEARGSGAIEIARGKSTEVYLRPLGVGTFPMECSHFLHSNLGMTGDIVVE